MILTNLSLLFPAVFLLVVMLLLVDSKKKKQKQKENVRLNKESTESDEFNQTHLELRGDIRKKFALIAATADITKSVICSPISALLPLGKLVLGATGNTEKQLNAAIGVHNKKEVKSEFKALLTKLKKLQGIHLDIASQVYLAQGMEFKSTYLKEVSSVFTSNVERLDVTDRRGSANKINAWVAQQTHGKIQTILTPQDISPSTSLILINAIYFSGKWKHPFKKVTPGTFYSTHGPITMPMMFVQKYFIYGKSETLDAQVIKIPYQKDNAFFYIFLPNNKNGLKALLDQLKLAPELINEPELQKVEVKLTMPKFKIETELDLGRLYQALGLQDMFSSQRSGLKEIIKDRTLKVDKAIHKAMIEVTEEGTEAAAVSAVVMISKSMKRPQQFTADHPFLFFIIARGEPIFVGTFSA